MTFDSIEKAVYNHLVKKHVKAGNYLLATQKNGNSPDIFRGKLRTKKTIKLNFWNWENDKKGGPDHLASKDIDFYIKVRMKSPNKFKIYLRYCVHESTDTELGKARRKFIGLVLDKLNSGIGGFKYKLDPKNHVNFWESFILYLGELQEIDDMVKVLDKTLDIFIPVIDKAIEETKKEFPGWKVNRVTKEEYENSFRKRFDKIALMR